MKFVKLITPLFLSLILSSSFSKSTYQNYHIVVGFAYETMDCNGLSVETAKGYDFQTASPALSGSALTTEVKSKVARNNGIKESEVIIASGYKPYAVIISYSKKIAGWNCSKKMYAVGFGDSESAAELNASEKKNMDTRVGSYTLVKSIVVKAMAEKSGPAGNPSGGTLASKSVSQQKPDVKESMTNQTTAQSIKNDDAKKQQEMEAERKKAQLAVQQVNQVLEDRVRAQREYDRKVNESAEAFGNLAGTFAAGIMQHQDAKDARELRAMEYKQQNEEKGKVLITQFMPIAEKGDELSIKQVIQGYTLMGEAVAKEDFLFKILQKHNSEVAYTELKSQNENIVSSFKEENKKYKRRALSNFIWSGIVAGGGLYLTDYISKNGITGDFDTDSGIETGTMIATALGGGWLFLTSVFNLSEIGAYKKDSNYKGAVSKLEVLDKWKSSRSRSKVSLSIEPSYSPMFNQPMLGLKLKF